MSYHKFFRFAYPSVKKPLLHNLRDADSFIQIMPLLIERGYAYGGLLLNFNSGIGSEGSKEHALSPQKGDVIVMTTRPPLDDDEDGPHLVISKSGSKLETDIFKTLKKKYLHTCSRRKVTLNESFEDKFESGFNDRISIQFVGHGKITRYLNVARYQATFDGKKRFTIWNHKDGCRTAAYFLYMGEAWEGGPDILVSFSMTGACNLIWAHLIRTRYPHFLDRYRIVVAEMVIDDHPKVPVDLSFAEDWDVKIVLNHEL